MAAYSTESSTYHIGPAEKGVAPQIGMENKVQPVVAPINLDTIHGDQEDDIEMEAVTISQSRADRGVPMTMRELADAAREHSISGVAESPANIKNSCSLESQGMGAITRNKFFSNSGAARSVRSTSPSSTASKPRGSARNRARNQKGSTDATQTLLGKRGRMDGASATSISAPTRVLRPRVLKTAVQIREEREMEQAYERAVAE